MTQNELQALIKLIDECDNYVGELYTNLDPRFYSCGGEDLEEASYAAAMLVEYANKLATAVVKKREGASVDYKAIIERRKEPIETKVQPGLDTGETRCLLKLLKRFKIYLMESAVIGKAPTNAGITEEPTVFEERPNTEALMYDCQQTLWRKGSGECS